MLVQLNDVVEAITKAANDLPEFDFSIKIGMIRAQKIISDLENNMDLKLVSLNELEKINRNKEIQIKAMETWEKNPN